MDDFGEKGPSLETENPFRKVGCTNLGGMVLGKTVRRSKLKIQVGVN
jgi:hypothetical protein